MSSVLCPDCISGTVSEGTPTGTITTIHGLPTYVAAPSQGIEPKGLVVIITDAFGYKTVNSQVLADQYAKKGGFLVYLPDFLGGNAIDTSVLSLRAKILKPTDWFKSIFTNPLSLIRMLRVMIPFAIGTRPRVSEPRVVSFFKALRSSPPPFSTDALKIGVAGFCWGGRYAVLLAADKPSSRVPAYNSATSTADGPSTSLIDCAFTAHPAMLKVPSDIVAVMRPLSVADGDEDQWMGRRKVTMMEDVLEKKGDNYECKILPGARHGFALRWDPKDEKQADYGANAEAQAIHWFTRWLS